MERADPEPDPAREFFVYDKHTDRIEPLADYADRLLEAGGKEPPTTWEGVQAELAALTRLDAAARSGEMLDADDLKQVANFKLHEFSYYPTTQESFLRLELRDEEREEDYLIRADIEFDKVFSEQYPDAKNYKSLQEYNDDMRVRYPPPDNDHER